MRGEEEKDGGGHNPRMTTVIGGRRGALLIVIFSTLAALLLLVGLPGLPLLLARSSPRGTLSRVLLSSDAAVQQYIRQACRATLYPDLCVASIAADPRSRKGFGSAYEILELAVEIASRASQESLRRSSAILQSAGGDRNLTVAARDCVQVLGLANDRYGKCLALFTSGFSVKDLEAWLSSVQMHQYDCFSALGYVNSSKVVQDAMVQAQSGIFLISNALGMADALDKYGLNVSRWQPVPTRRQQYSTSASVHAKKSDREWKWIGRSRLDVNQMRFSAVVGKDGRSEFESVQQAIDHAPSNSKERYVILVKAGVYEERVFVPVSKTKIMLVGEGIDRTIITGSNFVQDGVKTMDTSTMMIAGDDFIARNLTIRNTAGPELHQAVALRIDADRVIIQSCSLVGFQDTLYSHTLRHYFVDSTIAGTVDFIFGGAAAVFNNCKLLVRQGRAGIYTNMVTAHGRIDPGQTTGFAFHNCVVDTAPDFKPDSAKYKAYLGRPWKMYSRTVYVNCFLGSIVPPEGWLAWSGDFALDTLFYGEYESHGPGADDLRKRVDWSTQMNDTQVLDFSVHNFIQGDYWIPFQF